MDNYHLCLPNMPTPKNFPLKECGENVRIFQGAHIVGPEFIEIASNVIIDSGAILIASAECPIRIGNYVHIGAHSSVGGGPVVFEDFSGISHGVRLFGGCEDLSGDVPTNPTIPRGLRSVDRGGIVLGRHVVVGANSVVLRTDLPEGVVIGACSFVSPWPKYEPWTVYAGTPARKVDVRNPVKATLESVRGFKS